MKQQLLYEVGITLLEGVGDVTAKKLIAYCGGAEAVFRESKEALQAIPAISSRLIEAIKKQDVLGRAEEEIRFMEAEGIRPLFFLDADYPNRLKFCEDGPAMLYTRGEMNLNPERVIGLVGTRMATAYGREICQSLVEDLAPYQPLVVSGLAYGIDICAHRAALEANLPTVGVLAHGLDRLYPSAHKRTAQAMELKGGLVTDFLTGTNPDRENFPKRNRIVAGMVDALVVVESKHKGGALITAHLAFDYGREVLAVPGPAGAEMSAGCNRLIQTNRAALIEQASDLEYLLGWTPATDPKPKAFELPEGLSESELRVLTILRQLGQVGIDRLSQESQLPPSQVATDLLALEFASHVRSLPGKRYELA